MLSGDRNLLVMGPDVLVLSKQPGGELLRVSSNIWCKAEEFGVGVRVLHVWRKSRGCSPGRVRMGPRRPFVCSPLVLQGSQGLPGTHAAPAATGNQSVSIAPAKTAAAWRLPSSALPLYGFPSLL